MRISEMDNTMASEAMVRISAVANFLFEDKEIADFIRDLGAKKDEQTDILSIISEYLPTLARLALQKHRNDMFEIVGAIEGVDSKVVAKMNFLKTLKIIMENWGDLKDFFSMLKPSTGTADAPSI